ncbi:MAG: hypothetical protein P8X80_22225, partial [Desulfobacterales bacterium]
TTSSLVVFIRLYGDFTQRAESDDKGARFKTIMKFFNTNLQRSQHPIFTEIYPINLGSFHPVT